MRREQRKFYFGKGLHAIMVNNAQTYWNVVMKTYEDSDPSLPMVGHECTCLFHWCVSLEKVTHKYIKPTFLFQNKQICKGLQGCQDNGLCFII